ncbi:unnamed protein product [Didymodactylos carnosus]|uniref:Uncharacterized protein n=1 Tax=Didymodactylos carnosus TaxID=1234261 RepID=A0A813ZW90_9BILA|nr:unnamed protein product [Didymodactylos carnosus]CAF0906092.1 unnamed protein product [Didymodactylos carnosus]CAF3542348.1 unnamed protein product [Didymodactylos carnosus]CAF3687815.1 unnamed protein product [Didymodactylos carnosus]
MVTDHPPFIKPSVSINEQQIIEDDYQAPLTSNSLLANSKWKIIRLNLHKIRSTGKKATNPFQDWYLFLQVMKELKRAEQEIKNIENDKFFKPVKKFSVKLDGVEKIKTYKTSHVRPTDALFYTNISDEPIIIQHLLYYFTKEFAMSNQSLFWNFLTEVNSVLNTNRKRSKRTKMFKKIALILSISVYILITFMFLLLIMTGFQIYSDAKILQHDYQENDQQFDQLEFNFDSLINRR